MRLSHLTTLMVCAFGAILLSGCSERNMKARETGRSFLENMYTCNFKACDALCTEKGKEEVRWFASNLTEDDLAVITGDVEIEVENDDISDTIATIAYTARNVIVCDSLETKGHLGDRSLRLILKNVNGVWKVDKLEW